MNHRKRRKPRHYTAPGRPWGVIETDEPTDWQEERRKVGAFLRENVPGCLVLAVLFAAMVGFGVGLGFL